MNGTLPGEWGSFQELLQEANFVFFRSFPWGLLIPFRADRVGTTNIIGSWLMA